MTKSKGDYTLLVYVRKPWIFSKTFHTSPEPGAFREFDDVEARSFEEIWDGFS